MNILCIGLVFVFDCVLSGVYQDKGILVLEEWLVSVLMIFFVIEICFIFDE